MAKTFLISRTDSIGDVVLTLPVTAILKEMFTDCRIVFLGRKYTQPVIECCETVDAFCDWSEVENKGLMVQTEMLAALKADVIIHIYPRKDIAIAAMKSGIPTRIGSTGRLWHYLTCNRLVLLSRKHSPLHESQLNLKLLKPLGFKQTLTLNDIYPYIRLSRLPDLDPRINALLTRDKKNVILHPLSKGSAREWGLENFKELARLLEPDRYNVFVTGTKEEGLVIRSSEIFSIPYVYDLTGRLSLQEFIRFIAEADILVGASTGPLHLAAVMGKQAIGIYPPIRPMHPGRWAPLGPQAKFAVKDVKCNDCRFGKECHCMKQITPLEILDLFE